MVRRSVIPGHLRRTDSGDNRRAIDYVADGASRGGILIEPLNVAIAGCGTAGMASAILLARDGHHVTMFERFGSPKPIGSGLMMQPTGMAILADMGLLKAAATHGARIERLHGEAGGRTVLDVSYSSLPGRSLHAIGIHRSALFDILFAAVRDLPISIRTSAVVRDVNGWHLCIAGLPDQGPYDLIVDALGAGSPLAITRGKSLSFGALWANVGSPPTSFPPAALVQRYRRANVMAGLMPIGRLVGGTIEQSAFFWSLRSDSIDGWQRQGLSHWKREVLELWPVMAPILDQIVDLDQLTFARYSHRTARTPVEGSVIHIGDAWHSASPQLGQGANMALLDSYALALGLREAENLADGLRSAVAMRFRHVRLYQMLTALLTPVYQSESRVIPWVRDRVMAPLSRISPFPRYQAALVTGLIGNPLQRLGLGLAAEEREG